MIIEFLKNYGLIAIFIVILLEYACFPIPSEVVLPTVGAMVVTCDFNFWLVLLISILGGLIGSCICYGIGYFGGVKLFPKLTKKKGFLVAIEKYNKYKGVSVSFGRLIPICRTYISFVAGISKHKFGQYILLSSLGIIVWNACLITLGYYFYDNLEVIAVFLNRFKIIIIILCVIVVLALVIKKFKYASKKNRNMV